MDISRWSTPKSDWLYSLQPKMEKLYTVSKNKTRSWLWLRSWTPYWPKLRKVGKTSRPFGYDLNQIPYVYTMEVTNRFKGLDLIDRVPEEQSPLSITEVHKTVQEAVIKAIPPKKKWKMVVWGGLTNKEKRSERQRRKGKICPCECRVPKNSKER